MTLFSTATVRTEKASGYLQQLCKHFGHKIAVEYTPEAGWIQFEFGRADLSAGPDGLKITATAEEEDSLARLKQVLASHLERFAFREDLKFNWED